MACKNTKGKRRNRIRELLRLSCNMIAIVLRRFRLRLEDSPYRKDVTVVCIGNDDTCLARTCVNQLSVSCIDTYMTGVAYDITRLCIFQSPDVVTLTPVGR